MMTSEVASARGGRLAPQRSRSVFDSACRRGVFSLLGRLEHGALTVIDGTERFSFGAARASELVGAGAPEATVVVRHPAAYASVLFRGSVGAGEAYMTGQFDCDDLAALSRIFVRNVRLLSALDSAPARLAQRAASLVSRTIRSNDRAGSRRNILAHYDLSNDFFALFLDPTMTYSSALYPRAGASLEEAQRHKIEVVCNKLALRAGERLLEIGTGWGALAIHAAREYGCRVTTTTVSDEQLDLARARVCQASLEDRVEVLPLDYRDVRGTFDKVVSVEMVEAVGHEHLGEFFRACSERLAPGGVLLLQAITIRDQHHRTHLRTVDFIKKHVFPGSSIPSITSLAQAATRSSDLVVSDLEELTPHYARTLRDWRDRLRVRKADALALGFGERFLRKWEYYLASCEGAFVERYLGCVHIMFSKPGARITDVHMQPRATIVPRAPSACRTPP